MDFPTGTITSHNLAEATEALVQVFETIPAHKQSQATPLYPSRYCNRQFRAFYDHATVDSLLIVGMNPGPHGMGQTGGAFTDQPIMRALIGDEGLRQRAGEPEPRKVGRWKFDGGISDRSEDSASRLWPLLGDLIVCSGKFAATVEICAKRFNPACPPANRCTENKVSGAMVGILNVVARHVVMVNACPVLWLSSTGSNVSAADTQKRVVMQPQHIAAIHAYLRKIREILRPSAIVAAGGWAASRCKGAFGTSAFTQMLHPSPMNGTAEVWRARAQPDLRRALGIRNTLDVC